MAVVVEGPSFALLVVVWEEVADIPWEEAGQRWYPPMLEGVFLGAGVVGFRLDTAVGVAVVAAVHWHCFVCSDLR